MSDSIKKEADKILKGKNPNIFGLKKDRLLDFINDYNRWYIVVLSIIIIFFSLHLINIPFLNFIIIEETTLNTLINSRTTNIITMISITFAVIGFLIANLAIKESFTYNLLFKNSTFFPVAFIALSLMASFILLSTFTDSLPINYQKNALLVWSYLILVVIFLIGYLFTKLIRFTNQKYLLGLVRKELISESNKNLLVIGRKIISLNRMRELGLFQYSMVFSKKMTKGYFVFPLSHNVILDIKINRLSKIIKSFKEKDKIFVKDVYLNRKIENNEDGFFFVDESDYPNLQQIIRKLNNCIVTSKNNATVFSEAREYILQKLAENIKSNNDKLVESYLDILSEVYQLQQKFKI